jgi:hypothetical protein
MEKDTQPSTLPSKSRKHSTRRNVGALTEEFCDEPNVQKDFDSISTAKHSALKVSGWNCPIGASIFVCSIVVASISALHAPIEHAAGPSLIVLALAWVVKKTAPDKK